MLPVKPYTFSTYISSLSKRKSKWPSAMPKPLSTGRAFSYCHHLMLSLKVVQLHPYTEPAHLQTELLLFFLLIQLVIRNFLFRHRRAPWVAHWYSGGHHGSWATFMFMLDPKCLTFMSASVVAEITQFFDLLNLIGPSPDGKFQFCCLVPHAQAFCPSLCSEACQGLYLRRHMLVPCRWHSFCSRTPDVFIVNLSVGAYHKLYMTSFSTIDTCNAAGSASLYVPLHVPGL